MGKVKETLLDDPEHTEYHLDAATGKLTKISHKAAAVKYDSGKPRIGLIPPSALEGMADAFTYGAGKYGDHNWKKGLAWSRLCDATLRHFVRWMDGETYDKESGLNHLYHTMANLAMLIEYQIKGMGNDDRK